MDFKVGDKVTIAQQSYGYSDSALSGRIGTIERKDSVYWRVRFPGVENSTFDGAFLLLDTEMILHAPAPVEKDNRLVEALEEMAHVLDTTDFLTLVEALNNHAKALNRYCDLKGN
jgi:hypothetical protein